MIFRDFLRAVAQVEDPRYLRVLALGVACTLVLLVFIYGLVLLAVEAVQADRLHLPNVGEISSLGDLFHWGSLLMLLILSVILMIPVASAITAFFLDDIADAVEARHYPRLPHARRHGPLAGIRETLFYFCVLLAVNLLLLLPYAVLPAAAPLLFYGINGLLISREYFHLIALRRLDPGPARALRQKYQLRIWAAGILMVLALSMPLFNLLVPVLGAATFCHLFHRLHARAGAEQP